MQSQSRLEKKPNVTASTRPVTFNGRLLEIKVKNISDASLDKSLVIEISPPAYLVDDRIIEAASEAAVSEDPPGAKSLA